MRRLLWWATVLLVAGATAASVFLARYAHDLVAEFGRR